MALNLTHIPYSEKSADVIIVGGGVNGLWTSYHLATQGVKTLLLEQVFRF